MQDGTEPMNYGKKWTPQEIAEVAAARRENPPRPYFWIASRLKRTPKSIKNAWRAIQQEEEDSSR